MQSEIVMLDVSEVIPYWRNPRRNDKTVEALCEVIPKMGFNVPIVVDKNYVVVKGHARLKAAKKLGMIKVPCIISNASEETIKADRIADNKIQELSSWDFAKRDLELERLGDKMQFGKLFKTEEVEEIVPDMDYKPATDFGDVFADDADVPSASAETEPIAEYTPVINEEQTAESATDVTPQKKRCKTICPYCGEVVYVEL